VLAWLILTSKVFFLIKWPLGIGTGFFGAALAFLPVEERPLDVWIKNFFLGIFRPTMYLWKKHSSENLDYHKLDYFKKKPLLPPEMKAPQQKLDAYLQSLNFDKTASPLDKSEEAKINKIESLLSELNQIKTRTSTSPTVSRTITIKNETAKNKYGVRVRKLNPLFSLNSQKTAFQPKQQNINNPYTKIKQPTSTKEQKKVNDKPFLIRTIDDIQSKGQTPPSVIQAPPLVPPMKVKSLYPEKKHIKASLSAAFSMPLRPELPNVISGMLLNTMQKSISGAILEIKNPANETVRALKSNKLGHFFTATPLPDNDYHLFIEHPDWDFDIIDLHLVGQIVPPIKIIGKAKATN